MHFIHSSLHASSTCNHSVLPFNQVDAEAPVGDKVTGTGGKTTAAAAKKSDTGGKTTAAEQVCFPAGKLHRVPGSVWPKEVAPACGYWRAYFVKFADKEKNVFFQLVDKIGKDEFAPFWVATVEAVMWELDQ